MSGTPLEVPEPKIVNTFMISFYLIDTPFPSGTQRIPMFSLRVLATALVMVLGLLGSSCRTEFPFPGFLQGFKTDLDITVETLKNGLTVVLVQNPQSPVVSYHTWYRVGSVDEVVGKTGLAHLFEHMMFKGTERYGPRSFFTRLEMKGAEVNAQTSRDYTVFHETFQPALLDEVIAMESDRMKDFIISDTELDIEKRVVLEERLSHRDGSPFTQVQDALWHLAFKQHPYGNPVSGYVEDILKLTSADAIAFFRRHYIPAKAAVIVVGAIDSKATFQKIKAAYEAIPYKKADPRKIALEIPAEEERRWVLREPLTSRYLGAAFPITSAEAEDSFALDVLANILFEGPHSRAHQKLVVGDPLFDRVRGTAFTPTYPGLFIIQAVLRSEIPLEAAESRLLGLLQETQNVPVTQAEVDRAVRELTRDLVDGANTPNGMAQLLGTVWVILGDIRKIKENWEKYFKVTPADVQRVAKKYFDPNNRVIVHLIPENKIDAKAKGK